MKIKLVTPVFIIIASLLTLGIISNLGTPDNVYQEVLDECASVCGGAFSMNGDDINICKTECMDFKGVKKSPSFVGMLFLIGIIFSMGLILKGGEFIDG